ncbi:MAG: hypothetical protein NDI61_14665, partial [Bdellovibrionaceae bacterium]|nr:hypothetical protein [Pseudobdellovibrionaceae bacterium]
MNIPSRIFAGLLAALFAPTLFCLPSSATDADLLKRHPTVFKRDKGMLIIQLKNGSPALSRKDDLTPGLTYIRTSIEEYEPKRDLVLLRETYYEGGAYKLISLRSGTELKLPAKPVWSPDKIFFAVTNDDESDYTENVLRIGICSP